MPIDALGMMGVPTNFNDWYLLQTLGMNAWKNQADYFTAQAAQQAQMQNNLLNYQLGLGQNYNNRYATDASYASNLNTNATNRYGIDAGYAGQLAGYQNNLAGINLNNQGAMDRLNAQLALDRDRLNAELGLQNQKLGLVKSLLGNFGGLFGGATAGSAALPGINLTTNYGASATYGPPAGSTTPSTGGGGSTGGSGSGGSSGSGSGSGSGTGSGTGTSTGRKLRIARGNYNYRRGPKPIRFAGGTGYQRGGPSSPVAR